jgi:hypothetical protein
VTTHLLAAGSLVLLSAPASPQESRRPLAGRVVCVDPGHGGTAATDSYRVGPCGEREEWIRATRRTTAARPRALAEAIFLARPTPPIAPLGSRVSLPPFEVPREAGRMDPEARRWREAYEEGRALLQRGDAAALARAYDGPSFSARAFPDSPLAGECHRLRGEILERQGRAQEAAGERARAREHYVAVQSAQSP